jgi:hypothetical protein
MYTLLGPPSPLKNNILKKRSQNKIIHTDTIYMISRQVNLIYGYGNQINDCLREGNNHKGYKGILWG